MSKELIKILWQADKDFINLKQQKMDLATYFKKSKAMKKVVEELNHTAHGHAIVEIMCKEQNVKVEELGPNEAIKFIADGKERILGMQLIVNVDCDKYGTLIKDYDREYLGRINTYPKTLQNMYSMLKGWHKHEKTGQKYSSKIGVSFSTVEKGDDEPLVNDRAKRPKCSRCGRNSHTVNKCTAKYWNERTMLNNIREVKEVDYKINSEAGA